MLQFGLKSMIDTISCAERNLDTGKSLQRPPLLHGEAGSDVGQTGCGLRNSLVVVRQSRQMLTLNTDISKIKHGIWCDLLLNGYMPGLRVTIRIVFGLI